MYILNNTPPQNFISRGDAPLCCTLVTCTYLPLCIELALNFSSGSGYDITISCFVLGPLYIQIFWLGVIPSKHNESAVKR